MAVACSAYSWRLVAGHQERTAHVFHEQMREEGLDAAVHKSRRELPRFTGGLLDYHTQLLSVSSRRTDPVGSADVAWVRAHFAGFDSLAADSEPFRFALEASSDYRFQKDHRAAVARTWAGIEALFGISTELVHRLSLYAACLLEPRGSSRRERYHAVRKLYGERSKAVHGESMAPDRLARALCDSHDLLRDLLLCCVDLGHVPNARDLDDVVFG